MEISFYDIVKKEYVETFEDCNDYRLPCVGEDVILNEKSYNIKHISHQYKFHMIVVDVVFFKEDTIIKRIIRNLKL